VQRHQVKVFLCAKNSKTKMYVQVKASKETTAGGIIRKEREREVTAKTLSDSAVS